MSNYPRSQNSAVVRAFAFLAIAAFTLLAATVARADTSRFAFIDSMTELFGSATYVIDILSELPEVSNSAAAPPASMFVPLSGTYNIPGDYATLTAAMTDVNTQGVGGPVMFNVIAGNSQTAPAGGYVIGGTGSL